MRALKEAVKTGLSWLGLGLCLLFAGELFLGYLHGWSNLIGGLLP